MLFLYFFTSQGQKSTVRGQCIDFIYSFRHIVYIIFLCARKSFNISKEREVLIMKKTGKKLIALATVSVLSLGSVLTAYAVHDPINGGSDGTTSIKSAGGAYRTCTVTTSTRYVCDAVESLGVTKIINGAVTDSFSKKNQSSIQATVSSTSHSQGKVIVCTGTHVVTVSGKAHYFGSSAQY